MDESPWLVAQGVGEGAAAAEAAIDLPAQLPYSDSVEPYTIENDDPRVAGPYMRQPSLP